MITDPNLPAPQSVQDCVELLTIGGIECIKAAVNWIEENQPTLHPLKVRIAHYLLNQAGYLLEEATGVPDGSFGAGGTSKPW